MKRVWALVLALATCALAANIATNNGTIVLNSDLDIEFRGAAQGGFATSFSQLLAGISSANARTLTAAQSFAATTVLSSAATRTELTAASTLAAAASQASSVAAAANVAAQSAARTYTDSSLGGVVPTLATRATTDALGLQIAALASQAAVDRGGVAALNTTKAEQAFVVAQLAAKADAGVVAAALASRAEVSVVAALSTTVMDLSAGMLGLRTALAASLAVQQAATVNLSAALVAQRASQQLEATALSTTIATLSNSLQSFSTAVANQLTTLVPTSAMNAVNTRVTALEQQLQAARDCNASGGTMALVSPNSSSIYSCVYPGCQAVPATGVYWIRLPAFPADVFAAFCRVDADGTKWYLFQRRTDTTDFYRGWASYVAGFGWPVPGYATGPSFWLGLERLTRITTAGSWRLRVELRDLNVTGNPTYFAAYNSFRVGSNLTNYTLNVSGYDPASTAGDQLARANGRPFSTFDNDNDSAADGTNCAQLYQGAWWYDWCHGANLNGIYYTTGCHQAYANGVNWRSAPSPCGSADPGYYNSLQAWMLISPAS